MPSTPTVLRIFLSALALSCLPASAGTIAVKNGKVVEVTVYADRAEVVREATVEVPSGASSVEFADIPIGADPDSLRVSAKGVSALVGAVEIRERAETPKETAEQVALREDVQRIEGEIARLASQMRVTAELREFLKSLRATTSERESENLGSGKPDPAAIGGVYDLLAKRLTELEEQDLARNEAAIKKNKELAVAREKLATAPGVGSIRSRVAAAEMETKEAGSLTVRLSYLVSGASWTPSYRATLDTANGEVALVSEGVVRQKTGEDWSKIALRLSTAAPARGVAPPEVASLLLRPEDPTMYSKLSAGYMKEEVTVVQGRTYQNIVTPAPGPDGDGGRESMTVVAAPMETEVVHSAYNVAFEVPGRSEVPNDGADHRVVLHQDRLPGTLAYRTAPSIEPAAFLTSVVHAPEQYPLLSGSMRVLAGGAYLGVYGLPETAPGAELVVPFGRDNRIKIDRVRQPQDRSTEGFSGKTRQIVYEYKTRIENLRDEKVTISLEDRVPVSEDERIEVEMGKTTTPGHQPSKNRPGVVLWKLDLAPREKRDVLLAYTVRYPKDLYVPGLD